jgi:hypothetical protein
LVAEVWRRATSPLESPLTLPDPAVDQCERSKAYFFFVYFDNRYFWILLTIKNKSRTIIIGFVEK